MSLTELIVTMFIMSVVIIGAVSLTIGFQRTNAANLARQDAIDTARTTSESMSRTIRAAVKPSQLTLSCAGCTQDAFIEARDFSVRFYSNINNAGNTVVTGSPSDDNMIVQPGAPGRVVQHPQDVVIHLPGVHS